MNTFKLDILASGGIFYEGECESLVIPTVDGQYGILAHHTNWISTIVPGEMTFRTPDQKLHLAAVSMGLAKVENNRVMLMLESCERPEDIDINRAKRAAEAAQEALLQKRSMQEYRATQVQLARALNRLKVSEHKYG